VHDNAASKSALVVAAYRGRASGRVNPICNDPWARALAGTEGEALAAQLDERFPAMELWVAVRTAALDAHIAFWTSAPHSIEQIVMLGAGFDTRAVRLAAPGRVFFEVDHPASQAEKRRRVAGLAGYPARAATYTACDFETDDFLERLLAAGLRADAPALLLWEGVVSYLSEPSIRATVRRIAQGCHPRSILLFDHLLKLRKKDGQLTDDSQQFFGSLGEEVLFGTNDPLPLLYEEGFRHVRSVSFDEACLTLTGTYERAREFRFQRLVLASRTATGVP
jgi:methyltransferase (TIGR00027 family)